MPIWFNVIAYGCPIVMGMLFVYGAVVRGHRLHAPTIKRVIIGVIGAALLYFAVHGLVGEFTRQLSPNPLHANNSPAR